MIKGADFSSLHELESRCANLSFSGCKDAVKTLAGYGINSARLRLWVHPFTDAGLPYGGGTCCIETVKKLAVRAADCGMSIMLDFHYSDFWADPSKQFLPKAWRKLSFEEICRAAADHTAESIRQLKSVGVSPRYIQIGNEITNGMLWPHGKLEEGAQRSQGYERLFKIIRACTEAARSEAGDANLVLHLDRGGDFVLYREWFSNALRQGADFDIIGMSYYPYWHGGIGALERNINDTCAAFSKDIIVTETSFAFTAENFAEDCRPQNYTGLVAGKQFEGRGVSFPFTPQGQADFIEKVFRAVRSAPDGRGLGVYWWEPCWLPVRGDTWATESGRKYINEMHKGDGNEWANQALFDYDGSPLPALERIKSF